MRIVRTADARAIGRGDFFLEGESSGWLTPSGVIAVAMRRNVANLASSDLGLAVMADISRWTVCRSEIKTAACLIASSKLFWQMWLHHVFESSGHDSNFSTTILAYRQDSTNRSVWNRQKLCALELEASYIVASDPSCCDASWSRMIRLADVLPVLDGTGRATVSLTVKLLNSLGAPTWESFASHTNDGPSCHGDSFFSDSAHAESSMLRCSALPALP